MSKNQSKRTYEPLPGVVLSRVTPPEVSPSVVPRPHITEIFDRPAPHAVFMIAPSGYGKTAIAAEWASHRLDEVVWYTVAPTDTPADSILHMIQAFRRVYPEFAPWAEEMRNGDFDQNERIIDLANEIARVPGTVTLIVDNAHNFSPAHVPGNQLFTNSTPFNMRTITIRNSAPPVSYARAAALDVLTILTADELRLNSSEIEAIAGFYKIDSKLPEVKRVLDSAQGWPAGVKMLLKNFEKLKGYAEDGIGHYKNLDFIYLANAALEALPDEDRLFLESMTFFATITPALVEGMQLGATSQLTLRRMAIDGAFISEVGANSDSYEINPMLRQALISQVSAQPNYREIALKTSEVLIANQQSLEAIDLLIDLGESERAQKVIYDNARKMIFTGQGQLIRRWSKHIAQAQNLGEIGEVFVDTYASMVSDSLATFKTQFQQLLSQMPGTKIESTISGELAVMRCRIEFSEGRLSKAVEIALELPNLKYLPQEYMAPKALTGLRFGAAAAFLSEDIESLQKICQIAEGLPYLNDGLPILGLPAIQAMTALAVGNLKEARELAMYVIESSHTHKYAGITAPYDAHYVLAEVNREYMQYEEAITAAMELVPSARSFEMYPWLGALLSKAALTEASANRFSESLQLMKTCRAELSGPNLHEEIHRVVDENELFVRVLLRDTERVEELVFRMPKTTTISVVVAGLGAMRNPSAAPALLASLPRNTLREKLNYEILSATLKIQRPNDAQEHIHEAIHLAMTQGHKNIFLTQIPEFQNLLLTFANSHPNVYVESLASAVRANLQKTGANGAGLEQPLTKRELDILRRLSTGLPISQIASSLHISNNTIKTHLKNVYRKLKVDSRESAVEKGRELLLI